MAPFSQDHDPIELARRLSAELRRRAGEVDTIFDLLPIGIGIADDPACRDIRVNRAFADQLGIDVSQNASLSAPEGERPGIRVLKDGRELAGEELPMQVAAREGVEVRGFEVDVVRTDGRRVSLYQYAAPLFDEHGNVRGALGVFVDMTERRRVEQEQRFLAEASRVLASSLDYEPTLRALAHLAVPIFGDYCALDVQRDDGGFDRVEFVVQDPDRRAIGEALTRFPPRLSVDSPAARAIRTGEVVVASECPDDLLERSAQSAAHLDLLRRFGATAFMVVPLRARGRALGLLTVGSCTGRGYDERDVALATDVAGRAALALDNALLYRHAQEANRLKEEFLATLSHELRTPLNALLGWTQLLKGPLLDEAARARALDSIERNAQAQAVLINDLLDVSRAMSGKLRLNEQVIEIASVVLAAVDAVRPAVRARGLELNVALPPVTGEVVGDPDRLQQVIWNLLTNAVKFTPQGGRIDVTVVEPAGAVQVAVSDTGDGIPAPLLPYIFERFRQGDSSTTRAHGGLGLGLAIVRHLVDLHGGSVTATSDGPGTGARFVVTLPARLTHTAPEVAADGPREAPLAGVRVLGVDNDEDARELLLYTLRAAGADVMVVSSAASALDVLETYRPHVVVTDIAMPGQDGYGLAREIAARESAAPPVIGLSAYATARDQRQAIAAGLARCFAKPTDPAVLIAAIGELARGVRS